MLTLRTSPASPFGRKCHIAAIEVGLEDRLVIEATATGDPGNGLWGQNPLGKVPTLLLDDGTALFDSRAICEYLDSLHSGATLFPAEGEARWTALRLQALADGICDAAVARRGESLRPDGERSQKALAHLRGVVDRACDWLEVEIDALEGPLTIGGIAAAAALGYLDYRFGDERWRDARPRLAAWHATFADRPSWRATTAP